jgi:hypothetical protein
MLHHIHRRIRLLLIAGLAIGAVALAPAPAAAQMFSSTFTVTPNEGPVGTRVRIYLHNLPPNIEVFVATAIYPSQQRYQEVGRTFVGQSGMLTTDVTVPANYKPGDRISFAILTIDRRVLRTSRHFTVTEGTAELRAGMFVALEGLLKDGEDMCYRLQINGDEMYWLAGDIRQPPLGERVRAYGSVAESEFCGEGKTIIVTRVVPIPAAELDPIEGDDELVPPDDEPAETIMLEIEGRITDEGVTCLAMRDADDNLYTLTGEMPDLQPGDRVRVTGERAEMSICMQGTTIVVSNVERL